MTDASAKHSRRPNILLAIADDQAWPHAGAYGCRFVKTPVFDRVAREGVLFNNAFCPAPQCSPSRASLLTGRNIWQNEEAGVHCGLFPTKFPIYTDLLRDAGYHVGYTCKGWGPGDWAASGRDRNPAGDEYNKLKSNPPTSGILPNDYAGNFELFLADRAEGQPFCFWYGCKEPHRPYEKGSALRLGSKLADASVPAFLPDCDEIRSDLLDYAFEIGWYDHHLGLMLARLEEIGELDNTFVVVTSDNGMPFPRAKANLYEHGCHVPMAIRWDGHVPGGRVLDDFVSFIDLCPTFLDVAGIETPPEIIGRSIIDVLSSDKAGLVDPARSFVVTGRERHARARRDNMCYPCRCLRTGDYLYVRNFKPDRWPAGDPDEFRDIDGSPSKRYILDNRGDEQVRPYFDLACGKRPAEELYDLSKDPDCTKNVAGDPACADAKAKLWARLKKLLRDQNDPRVLGYGDIFDSYPYTVALSRDGGAALGGCPEGGEYHPLFQQRAREALEKLKQSKS